MRAELSGIGKILFCQCGVGLLITSQSLFLRIDGYAGCVSAIIWNGGALFYLFSSASSPISHSSVDTSIILPLAVLTSTLVSTPLSLTVSNS
jgi:hypothetical protein